MTNKHTPGPWSAVKCCLNPTNANTIVSENGTAVCSIEVGMKATGDAFEGREGEFRANANLIASAPELLEALETLTKLHHDWFRGSAYVTVAFEKQNNAAIAQARAALAKATGQS